MGRPRSTRRLDILEHAAALFGERGYRATTLTDLADSIGIAKATLFHHFPTKEQILFELYARAMDLSLQRISAVDDPERDPAEVVRAMVREHALLIMQNDALFTIFFDEEASLDPEHLAVVKAQQRDYINMISTHVARLQRSGRVRKDLHRRIAVQAMIGAGSWTYRWYEPGRDLRPEEIADVVADIAVRGLLDA
ncbi:MAG TPA: TetR/AcrR family transcriptional regulator [Solirubrobacteraceae bacterium]|nr:TetR/AcrR family transcriptional regulator [Solirubrobacteraceae bacterium]